VTEAEWLTGAEPFPMLYNLRAKASARKLGLFGYACWHRLRHLLRDERLREYLRLLELHADGRVPGPQLAAAREAAREARRRVDESTTASAREREVCSRLVTWGGGSLGRRAAERAVRAARDAAAWVADWAVAAEAKAQCDLLRDIFGNPFRPVAAEPSWTTWNGGVVGKLAGSVYEERAFERLPVLADALEEAGCTDADLLAHCRGGGGHVRGCWVVDLLVGKS
jgi:hypothetical protein